METMTPTADTDIAAPLSQNVAAQVMAALRQAIPPAAVRERFGLSPKQFGEIIRQHNLATQELLHQWQNDTSGYEEEQADAIERALTVEPLSLREVGRK